MKRLPIVSTIIVVAAAATMVALGVWQLQRAAWKNDLLSQYASAEGLAPVEPPLQGEPEQWLFRRASVECQSVNGWRAVSGRNRQGGAGYVHIADCVLPSGGDTLAVVTGWSQSPDAPNWTGGAMTGQLAPDSNVGLRLVADTPVDGLAAAAPPDPADIPNNHMAYAGQWFFFAIISLVIYALALRRRRRETDGLAASDAAG